MDEAGQGSTALSFSGTGDADCCAGIIPWDTITSVGPGKRADVPSLRLSGQPRKYMEAYAGLTIKASENATAPTDPSPGEGEFLTLTDREFSLSDGHA